MGNCTRAVVVLRSDCGPRRRTTRATSPSTGPDCEPTSAQLTGSPTEFARLTVLSLLLPAATLWLAHVPATLCRPQDAGAAPDVVSTEPVTTTGRGARSGCP